MTEQRTLPERLREHNAPFGYLALMDEAADALDAKSALLAEAVKALDDAMPAFEWMYSIMNGGPKRSATLAKLHNARAILTKLKAANAKPAPQPEGHGAR